MTTHPPIPPGCRNFERHGDGFLFYGGLNNAVGTICVRYPDSPHLASWRPVIAAVARCAWLDAAANALAHRAVSQDAFGVHATVRSSQDLLEAIMQAEAWRAWGESKD